MSQCLAPPRTCRLNVCTGRHHHTLLMTSSGLRTSMLQRYHHQRSSVTATELFRSLLLVTGMNYHVTHRLLRPCEIFSVDWRLPFHPFLFRLSILLVKKRVIIEHFNRSCFLLTYYTCKISWAITTWVESLTHQRLWLFSLHRHAHRPHLWPHTTHGTSLYVVPK